jgi:hypothetical protein
MKAINFLFRAEASPDAQRSALEAVKEMPGVRGAAHVKADSSDPTVARMATAYIADDANLEAIRSRVEAISHVERASIPAERGLV